jgi:hypothetical protein
MNCRKEVTMRLFHAAATLAVLLATATACSAKPRHTRLPEGTAVMLVGRISSEPDSTEKMQVSLGPRQVAYSLHLSRASVLSGPKGHPLSADDFHHGQWVRAEGRIMNDTRRIMVSRIRLITRRKLPSLAGTAYNRRGYASGYLVWPYGEARVAGSRYIYRRHQ